LLPAYLLTYKFFTVKNKLLKTFASMCLLGFISCKKVIFRDYVEGVAIVDFYKNANDAESGLLGCYNKTLSWDVYGKFLFYSDISSDDIQWFTPGGDLENLEKRNLLIPFNGEISSLWGGCYNALSAINLLLDKVPSIPDDKFLPTTRKKEILAEARGLRAYIYWHMVQFYGGVPLVLNFPTSTDREVNQIARNTAEEVIAQVKADLAIAEKDLPIKFNDPRQQPDQNLINSKGRFTKAAAKNLSIRILMLHRKWQEAAAKAQEIADLNEFIVNPKFVPIFRANDGGQNTKESIWESQSVEQPGQFDNTGVLKFFYTGPPRVGATESIYALYDTGSKVDVRKEQSMFKVSNPTFIYAQKYKNFYSNEPNDNYVVMRYAEVLFSRAEALNEIGYPNQEVLDIINSFRARAEDATFRFGACSGISLKTFADVPTQEAMRQLIYDEKRREMTQEGLRWFDMIRRDRAAAAAAVNVTDQNKLLFPIPQGERDRNLKLTQNLGY
jgi:starch-binding outer membrane protein, SusD/RagB family